MPWEKLAVCTFKYRLNFFKIYKLIWRKFACFTTERPSNGVDRIMAQNVRN